MISSRRFREKTSASDRRDGRSSGRRADKPDSPAARRGNAPYASRQTQHPFSAGSRGRRHQPLTPSSSPAPPTARRGRCAPCPPTRTVDPTYAAPRPRRRRPARRGRCAPPLSLHRANPGRAAWERRVRRRGGHGSCDPGSVECATPEGMGASDLGDRAALGHGCVPCTGHECATCPRWIVEAGRCTRFNGHSTTIAPLMWDNRKA